MSARLEKPPFFLDSVSDTNPDLDQVSGLVAHSSTIGASEGLDEKEARWRLVLPGISGDLFLAVVRLLWWLLLLSYTEDGPPAIRLILVTAWIAAFLWRYVFRRASNAAEDRKLALVRAKMGLSVPRELWPVLASVYLITTLAVPWWGATFTGGCARSEWVDSVWPAARTISAPGFPLILGALLIVLSTATYPLVEEFSMRGWLLVPLRERIGTHWAIFAIAALFAFLHSTPNPGQVVTIFLVALGYGYAVVATGSLWAAVAMHFAWNFTNYMLAAPMVHPYFRQIFRESIFRCGASRAMVVLTSVAFAVVLLAARQRRLRMRKASLRAD